MNILLLIITHLLAALAGFFIHRYFFCGKRKLPFDLDSLSLNSSSLISNEKTVELVGNYDEKLELSGNPSNIKDFNEAKLAWVSFSDLRNYMRYIEFLSIKNKFLNLKNMGIRIYYGRYPDTEEEIKPFIISLGTINEKFVGRHTIVMVPTYNTNGTNTDFNPHFIDEKGSPIDLKSSINKLKNMRKERKGIVNQTKNKEIPVLTTIQPETVIDPNEVGTNINLNTFGLTPPTLNSGAGAAYLNP